MEEELHKQLTELQSELTKLKKTIEYLESAEKVIETSEEVTKTLKEILPSFEKLREAVELLLKKIEEIDFDRELKEIKSRLGSIINMAEDIQRDLRGLKDLSIDEFGKIKNRLDNIIESIESSTTVILDKLTKQEKILLEFQRDIKFIKGAVLVSSVIIILFLAAIFFKLYFS